MDPMRFKSLGPSKDMSFLCTHVFPWTQKPHVYWWTQKIIQGPLKDTRFWVHQKKWGFMKGKKSETRVFWVHQNTWGFKRGRVHQKTWGFWVHQKTWGFMRGKTKMGPSKHMRFLVHQMKFCIKFVCAHEDFLMVVTFQSGVTGGAGANPPLGSANTVWC